MNKQKMVILLKGALKDLDYVYDSCDNNNIAKGKVKDVMAVISMILNQLDGKESVDVDSILKKYQDRHGLKSTDALKKMILKRLGCEVIDKFEMNGETLKLCRFENEYMLMLGGRIIASGSLEEVRSLFNEIKSQLMKEDLSEGNCMKIDEKTSEDGLKVELVKCGEKYIIFINDDYRYGVFDDELEARSEFDEL